MDSSQISQKNAAELTQQSNLQTQHNHQELIQELQNADSVSFFERHRISAQRIVKVAVLLLLLSFIVWFAVVKFQQLVFQAKKISKIRPNKDIQQLSGLDEEGYRSYFFFRQMQKMAKENVRNHKPFDLLLATNRFNEINFNELYGLFKVVKAIQNAKGYSALSQNGDIQVFNQTIDEELLQKYYNYTQLFPAVTNQYQCNSCYSFPIAATVQYIYKKHFNISVKLSQQQLIDCSAQDDTVNGCTRGNITKGFQYVTKIGLVEQSQYPYRSKTGHSFPCREDVVNNPKVKKYKIDGYKMLPKENCVAIQAQITKGNVVAAMMSSGELNQYTQSETAAFRNCPKEPFNHAITIVGQTQKREWIIRNSWGSSFGQKGYFTMKGGNTCGICTHAFVPFVNK